MNDKEKIIIDGVEYECLQAENEQLKEQLSGKTFFCENCERLARENEELKKEIKNWKNLKPIDVTEFCQTVDNAFNNTNKYKQALEEIREMVNEPCVPSENDCLTCPTSCFTKDILIKINEVLG